MKLATVRTDEGTRAARLTDDGHVLLDAPDVGALLARDDWADVAASARGQARPVAEAVFAPVVPRPGKILCVGLNYRPHILEMGRDLPEHPTLFAKFADALIGARDDILLPPESSAVDWEAELTVVIGRTVRRATEEEAERAIAGFTIMNDVSMRDWQFRTKEWLQGKTFDSSTPLGPVMVTPDELPGGVRPALSLGCRVDGEVMQKANTSDLVFDPVTLVRYASTIITLRPGDVIATGTPGGVGHARKPPRYLTDGATVVTEIEGIGRLENTARTA
ncbi:fumarylacetoacetate hydrolase family protein [Actinomadura sp. NPDC047616]|uniref:fumarylacetoacetate hydrolase family protein n=1 Tax=Actinomadura sp. NPDC047616 TaxID=3155914 RepID=UPI0033D2A6B1